MYKALFIYITLTVYWRKPWGLSMGPYCHKFTNYKVK